MDRGLTFGEMMRVRTAYRRMRVSAWWRAYVCHSLTIIALSDWRNSDDSGANLGDVFEYKYLRHGYAFTYDVSIRDTRQIEGACRGLLGRAIDAWKRATTYQDGTVRAIERWPTPGGARSVWRDSSKFFPREG